MTKVLILGGGVTGLAAGIASGYPIVEVAEQPGGICSSYYIRPSSTQRLAVSPQKDDAYRFEIGGGHWIFGGDKAVLHNIQNLTSIRSYSRLSSVFFRDKELYVPYPLQNNLGHLGKKIALTALTEMADSPRGMPRSMADWMDQNFGSTLTEMFFAPFHELYTAGLWRKIAPQDSYKSPSLFTLALQGAIDKTIAVGYNTTFIYPIEGLDSLTKRMSERCDISYNRKVKQIEVSRKEVVFTDGSSMKYQYLISTLPLNKVVEMTSLKTISSADPYTSVLVLNVGAKRGHKCPKDHWLYNPDSRSGFHRIGFYSNVDSSFLPSSSRDKGDRVSIYVERSYMGGDKPNEDEIKIYSHKVIQELQEYGFIGQVEVVDPTWIEVAYTWSWPDSKWRQESLRRLEENDIFQVGRYGRWQFQGIADSIRDGFVVGSSLK